MKRLIDVNCGTPTVMMSFVLSKMLKKRKGVIINFGSFVGEANCPNPTVYPSTKTFCHKLTRDLQVCYQDSGVIFQTVMPGVVGSPMAYNLPGTLLIPKPDTYTKSLIKTVGWVDETCGYIPYGLQPARNLVDPKTRHLHQVLDQDGGLGRRNLWIHPLWLTTCPEPC